MTAAAAGVWLLLQGAACLISALSQDSTTSCWAMQYNFLLFSALKQLFEITTMISRGLFQSE